MKAAQRRQSKLGVAADSLANVLSGVRGMSVNTDILNQEIVVTINEDAKPNDVRSIYLLAKEGWEGWSIAFAGVGWKYWRGRGV